MVRSINVLDEKLSQYMFHFLINRRDGVVVRASASQSVDLGFISQVELHQKTLCEYVYMVKCEYGIHSFPAWRSAHKG